MRLVDCLARSVRCSTAGVRTQAKAALDSLRQIKDGRAD